ncbi:PAS domain S-box protein [Phormidesmis priestleyi ULC007]|uniref:Circadian input-output histidine kinase CikA n=1 Tax=Phormidesmis priestleyi ULC007 TaxID=1920490 RepID=A0A2T1DJZ7_9CYAN|nr:PAS domain-containing protein [Phormidesmis priestleyi]PSB20828.1 PAS domain S-box protein [Phormidesmis priestleyi ULC007]PZO51783.1 MAG: PAS domain S-box protein [Phormidesmis priestleyi]
MNETKPSSDRGKIAKYLDTVDQRAADLYKNIGDKSLDQPKLALSYLAALANALEELRVVEEEICRHNEVLQQARQELENERHRYQELFDFAPDGYLVTDIHGKIHDANRAAAELLNVPQKYLSSKVLTNFVPEEQRRVFRSLLLQLRSIDRIQEWEISLLARSKPRFEAAITVVTVKDSKGKVIALRWLIRDITARKQMEAQLHQIQLQNLELIEADRVKAQFIATMSHELRTPLNAILGFSSLLLRHVQRRFEPQQFTMIERIFENGRHLLSLIDDVLDFSKLRSHQLELQLETFDLANLVVTTVEELKPLGAKKNLDLQVHLVQDHILVVNDRNRVRQIIVNLLSNAIKFTDEGQILIEVDLMPRAHLTITVRDTGIGIAEADLTFIFQEFRQANQTMTRSHGGTGLGLAITKALTELIGGNISVESELGQGSTFIVELPCQVQLSTRKKL